MKPAAGLLIAAALLPTLTAAEQFAPSREQFEMAVKARMGVLLRDPESARYAATSDIRRFDLDLGYGDRRVGWGSCYTINAKNGYGGYTGPERYLFITQDATQTVTFLDQRSVGMGAEALDRECPPTR